MRRTDAPRAQPFEPLEPRTLFDAYVYHDPLNALGISPVVAENSAPAAPEGVRYVGYGSAATGLGDLDADGFGDYAVSAPGTFVEDGLPTAGAVFVRSGRTGDVLFTFGDGAPGFGLSLLDMGDINADGLHDLAIGSPRYGSNHAGRVWIFSGATGEELLSFDGAAEGDDFGWAIAVVPDRDFDGRNDVLIGAPGAGEMHAGEAYILGTGSVLGFFEGTQAGERFGASVAVAPDGRVVIGSPRHSPEGLTDAGRIAIYDSANLLLLVTDGGAAGDRFGSSLAIGLTEQNEFPGVPPLPMLFVGVPGADLGGLIAPTLADRGGVVFTRLLNPSFDSWLHGPDVINARFGERLALVGDLDGDGGSDLGVLAPGVGVAGEAYFFGVSYTGVQSFGYFSTGRGDISTGVNVLPGAPGLALGGVGDINNDGFPDVLLGDASHTAQIYGAYAIGGPLRISGASPDLRTAWYDGDTRSYLIVDGVIRTYDKVPGLRGPGPGEDEARFIHIDAAARDGTIAFHARVVPFGAPGELLFLRDGVARPLSFLVNTIEGTPPTLADLSLVRLHDNYHMLLGGTGTYELIDGVLVQAPIGGVDMNSGGLVVGSASVNGVNRSVSWSRESGITVLEGMENVGRVREDGAIVGVVAGTAGFLDPGRLAVWQDGVLTDLGVGPTNVYTSTVPAHWVFHGFDETGRILADVVTNSYRGPLYYTTYLYETATGLRRVYDAAHGMRSAASSIGFFADYGRAPVPATQLADDGRIVVSNAVLLPVDDDAPYVLRADSPSVSLSAPDGDFVAGINQYDELVLFRRLGAGWERRRLSAEQVTSGNDNLVLFSSPRDGLSYLVLADRGRMDLYRIGADEVAGMDVFANGSRPGDQHVIVDNLAVLTSTQGTTHLVGTAANGDLVLYFNQAGADMVAPATWVFDNITQTHLAARGLDTPRFVSNLTTFATPWSTMHIAGLDADGHVEVVWWAPDSPLWRLDDLTSNALESRTMVGRVSAFVTPWNTLHINGTDQQGEAVALWWASGFGGNWRVDQLITNPTTGTPRIEPSSLASYTTAWGGLNVVGRDRATGRAVAYWWSPEAGRWTAETISLGGGVEAPELAGVVSAGAAPDSELHVAARTAEGHVARLSWSPGDGAWSLEDLTAEL
jgi:hypothetical protein